MDDKEEKPAQLFSTKPPPGEERDSSARTRVALPPEDVLEAARAEEALSHAGGRSHQSSAPTARPPAPAGSAPPPRALSPLVSIVLGFVVITAVLALLAR